MDCFAADPHPIRRVEDLGADKDPVVMKEDCSKCGPACICDAIFDCKCIMKGDDDEG